MAITRNFSENLEKDFEKLTAAIDERRSAEKMPLSEREIVKKSFEVFVPPSPSVLQAAPADDFAEKEKNENQFLPEYLQEKDADPEIEKKIEFLIELALAKGLAEACRSAQKEKPFIVDAFHDALTDKLLPELRKRGVVRD